MALPKKGSRVITVRGGRYRWKGRSTITVVREDAPRCSLRVVFDLDHAEPKQVAEVIGFALDQGWDAALPGLPFVIENGNAILPEHEFWEAIGSGNLAVVEKSLRDGANPDTCFQGTSALSRAVSHRHSGVVRVLLEAGAGPDGGSDDWPPLTLAAGLGLIQAVALLLGHGAAPHKMDKYGRTALSRAQSNCYLEWIKMGHTRYLPTREDFVEIADLLIRAGATH